MTECKLCMPVSPAFGCLCVCSDHGRKWCQAVCHFL